MSSRILILGATGRLGYAAAESFRDAGWSVVSQVRPGAAKLALPRTRVVEIDPLDHAAVSEAAHGADVVLHALNPAYQLWRTQALPFAYSAIAAAERAGATLMFPGNLYNYGSPVPAVIDETAPMHPTSHKGRIRIAIEDRLQEAAEERGLRVIIVRAGDYFGSGHGSWLDLVIAKDITRLRLTYPGPLEVVHEWAYLPNLAAALVRIADKRAQFSVFETLCFPGHAVTGREFTTSIAKVVQNRLQVKRMGWWLIKSLAPFVPLCRELAEIAYLWNEPHRINGDKLRAAIGDVPHTPLDAAVARAIQNLAINA
jgi:nucleoside-diphosphate-sugar epimerase